MARIITISNHKGGVGKTTSAINIGAGLHKMGKKVLLVDADPQANLTQSLGIEEPETSIYGALKGDYPLDPIEILPGLDLVGSTLDLSGAEVELSTEKRREFILKNILAPLGSEYEFIFIDSPPSLGLLTINALTASQEIFIPLQAEYLALRGLTKLQEVVERISGRLNPDLSIGAVFITQYDSRTVLHRDVRDSIKNHFGDKLLSTPIRRNISLAEAPTKGVDIFRYDPNSAGAEDYLSLSREILETE